MSAAGRVVVVGLCAVAVGASGCSSSHDNAATVSAAAAAARAKHEAIVRHDVNVTRLLGVMHQAALIGDRGRVAEVQGELERFAVTDPRPRPQSSASDPYLRMVDEFALKRAPLFVQQLNSRRTGHRLFAGVDRATFCLMTPDSRRTAVERVFAPLDRRLRTAGVHDFEFVVVPLTRTAPRLDQALAVARGGKVRPGGGCP